MVYPTLTPTSQISKSILPSTGTIGKVAATLPFGIYSGSNDFIAGAADQVAYTYKKLGGDVLDIELTEGNVYASYEESVLEYSYIVNMHQAKNVMGDLLGATTGTFDQYGEYKAGTLSSSLNDSSTNHGRTANVALRWPKAGLGYARRFADRASEEAGIGGHATFYSASIALETSIQDYDVQQIIAASASQTTNQTEFYGKVGTKKVLINRVWYKSPRAIWRFYGYYGGLVSIGNLTTYGQYADDSTWQLIPPWQNKAQAASFEDAMNTRVSHYSYEIRNNKLRIFPPPDENFTNVWVEFRLSEDAWEEESDRELGTKGVNNMSTLPFANIAYENINAIGKQWIRRFALSLSKETLGHIRGKFTTIPIPGESVTLNGAELLSQAKEEQDKLREELKTTLDELTYADIAEMDALTAERAQRVFQNVPSPIFLG